MQDRYAGDVGDFVKLGLLRGLNASIGLREGVNWHRAVDESHNADGKHTGYLSPSSRHHQSLRACDPDLMDRLSMVVKGLRSVAALVTAGVMSADTLSFAELLPAMGDNQRRNRFRGS